MTRKVLITELMLAFETLRRKLTPLSQDGTPTPAQGRVLFIVFFESVGQPLSIKNIAEMLGISSSAATQLVDGLVKDNLLKRKEDPADRRRIIIEPTKRALRNMESLKNEFTRHFTEITESLTNQELKQLLALLSKIIT